MRKKYPNKTIILLIVTICGCNSKFAVVTKNTIEALRDLILRQNAKLSFASLVLLDEIKRHNGKLLACHGI